MPQLTLLNKPLVDIGTVEIQSRRYLGNKFRVLPLISKIIKKECGTFPSFCDIFAGTGVVGNYFNTSNVKIIANDIGAPFESRNGLSSLFDSVKKSNTLPSFLKCSNFNIFLFTTDNRPYPVTLSIDTVKSFFVVLVI